MSRTKGSGWGAGPLFYQICPKCGKKKALYRFSDGGSHYKCTSCKEWFNSNELLPLYYMKQYNDYIVSR